MGVEIVNATSPQVVGWLDQAFAKGDIFPVTFANSNLLSSARNNPELKILLERFIVLNDGLSVDIASLIIHGRKFSENLNGTDFLPFFLENTSHSFRIFALGGQPGVAEVGVRKLAERFTRHKFVGSQDGYFSKVDEKRIVEKIRTARADLLLIGLGNPKQEKWLDQQLIASGCKIGFAVGAFLDFSSGRIPRAPRAMRKMRMEWLFRLILEPRRLLKRYTVDGIGFIFAAFFEKLYPAPRLH